MRRTKNLMGCAVATALLTSCATPPRPSILLVVLDTTRVDAVSAYGPVAGTTSAVDGLAAEGLRYTAAYAQANWTLPSHATIFTGRLPTEHGMKGYRAALSPALPTLAELLRKAGYDTAAFSENPWLTEGNGMSRGFDRFRLVNLFARDLEGKELGEAVGAWIRERDASRPYFLFINIMDAHAPYAVRAQNPYLPAGINADAARGVSQDMAHYMCRATRDDPNIAVLRGLYLGGVQAADRELADVLARLRDGGIASHLVTVITADHGEYFGEHRLVDHGLGVHEPVLHVPLVVHGLTATPAVVPDTVMLADLMPTILRWAGIEAPKGLIGAPLPEKPGASARVAIAEYSDPNGKGQTDLPSNVTALVAQRVRSACGPEDRVFGDMRAIVRYPWKLVTYARYPAELYDLAADPGEENDLAAAKAPMMVSLSGELERTMAGLEPAATGGVAWEDPPEVREQLRALGYLGGD